jgi:O-antigen/teichoic acid export membrane protein
MHPLRKITELLEGAKREPISAALMSLAGDSAVYLAGGMLVGLGNFVLIPLYTRCLPPQEFGVYALVDVTVLLVVTVSALKLDVSYLKWFADTELERHGELLGSTLMAGLVASVLGGLALSFLVGSHLGEMWLHGSGRSFAWMLFPIVASETLQALFLADLRARRRAVCYSAVGLVRLPIMVVASYYLLAVRQMGLPGLFLGRLAGDGATLILLIIVSVRLVVFRISLGFLKPMLRFGLPLVWSVFTVMLQDASGRYFLSRYGTMEQVGLLGAAIKIGSVFQVLISVPFGVAWGGVLFQIVKEREAQVIYSKIFGYVYVLALGMALVLTIFGSTLFHLFTSPAYYPAVALLPLIFLVRAMSTIEQPASVGIYLSGRTSVLGASYTVALSLNALLLWLLVPRYGIMGVGWAWLLGSAAVPLLFLILGQKHYRLSFSAKLLAVPILLLSVTLSLAPSGYALWPSHVFLFQCVLSLVVLLVIGALVSYDLRSVRQQIRLRERCVPVLEVTSQ